MSARTISSKKPLKVAVVGASGYAGLEVLRILAAHPMAEPALATSDTYRGQAVREVFPMAELPAGFCFSPHAEAATCRDADVFITALPHGKSYGMIEDMLKHGKVVDISADFRLENPADYDRWYDFEHPMPQLLEDAVYGLTEIYRKDVKTARLVANPGCYPTSVGLALHPLEKVKEHIKGPIIVDSKSGYSGAGRSLKPHLLFSEATSEFMPYSVTGHRHTSEMLQESRKALGWSIPVSFTPHLIPAARGIVSTIYVPLQGDIKVEKIREVFNKFYSGEKFVRLMDPAQMPSIKKVAGTNLCLLNVFMDEDLKLLKIISAIDNLVKGAAGQAVQNMNVMFGLPEDMGLDTRPLMP